MNGHFNDKGLEFLKKHTTPLEIDSMDAAAKAIQKCLEKGPARNITPEQWARHLAWVIGFDHLIEDRNAIRKIVELLV